LYMSRIVVSAPPGIPAHVQLEVSG
jgi:hypothetical protein